MESADRPSKRTGAETDGDTLMREVADALEPGGPGEVSFQRGATLGRYVVLDRIGQGGMAVVFSAYDPELDRKVALKLLRPVASAGEEAQARLLREAQATARLQHPNVVTVYDVGEMDGRVFAAMELIDGVTMRRWLAEHTRSWRDIVRAFVQAGHGLAAAHRKGLVHRDFKPDNALVDAEGRVRVADFGLARTVDEWSAALPADAGAGAGAEPRSPALAAELTRTGTLMGTPAYMSPEQRRGASTDARTDQYSFCVALFEALYGQRPAAGRDVSSLSAVAVPRVPARIRRALLKGLNENPVQRHPSMEALLAELQRPPLLTLPRAAGAALLMGVLLFAGWRSMHPQCTGGEQAWGDVWSAPRREAVRAAFGSSAAEEFGRIDSALQILRADWIATRAQACFATRRGEQSQALLDLRMQCLDDRRREAEALARLFENATPAMAAHADEAVEKLTPLSRCADARALTSRQAPPSDTAARAHLEEAKGLLARAKALLGTSEWASALPVAQDAVRAAQRAGYKPVEAEALYLCSDALRRLQRTDEARTFTHAAAAAAIEGRDDGLAADAFMVLAVKEGFERGDHPLGELWTRYAHASIERLGGDDWRQAQLEFEQAHVYKDDYEHLDLSRSHLQKSLELYRKVGAPETRVAQSEATLAMTEADLGNLDEGIRLQRSALDTLARHGRENFSDFFNLGSLLIRAGRPKEAQKAIEHGLELLRRSGAPSYWGLHNLAWALRENGRPEEALRLDREQMEGFEKAGAQDHWLPLAGLGEDLLLLGRPLEAIAPLERAVHLFAERKKGSTAYKMGLAQFALARALWDSGADGKRALKVAAEARENFRGPAQKYGSYYARHLREVERWLEDRQVAAR